MEGANVEIRQRAERVLLARCCDHPGWVEECECATEVAADVAALEQAGLLAGGGPR